ncbi:hypothetical protein KV697_12630 [Sphingomonas sanguinis]|uniref:hypothetical protein n=1 Tax=Sphingomonas sanguinis TaxID=33051 RepID=UPI001C57C85E|nr:hypothetical protein [Sphingomonas sanguinis]QXT34644.1 hypothetical protein KV697_12630 [Sphingomonas sanguinis]
MDYRLGQPRRIATSHTHGPFPRAQGGQCDFRPALTMVSAEADDPATVRAVYPRPTPGDDVAEGWVRVRW